VGYCCVPYRVNFKRLREVRGSRDRALIDAVTSTARSRGFLDEPPDPESTLDDSSEDWDSIDRGIRHAARAMVFGEPVTGLELAHKAMELLLCTSGRMLAHFTIPAHAATLASVATMLQEKGLAARLDLQALLAAGDVLPVLPPDPEFTTGFWTAAQVQSARGVIEQLAVPAKAAVAFKRLNHCIDTAATAGLGLVAAISTTGSVVIWIADIERLRAIPGSRNEIPLKRLDYYLQWGEDDWDEDQFKVPDEEFDRWLSLQQPRDLRELDVAIAAEGIINGGRLRGGDDANFYVAALELIVEELGGTMLDNAAVAPAAPDHFTAVDAALAERALTATVSMQELVFGGPPIKLPAWDDFPQVGHLSPKQVQAARGVIRAHDWASFPANVQETLATVDRWIDEAAGHKEGLICFYK